VWRRVLWHVSVCGYNLPLGSMGCGVLFSRALLGSDEGVDDPLMDAGQDSGGTMELKNTIASRTGVGLPVTAAFDYPSSCESST
jgi:hypothetical protein